MAEIKPFRGIRYHWEALSSEEMGALVAPPYDVIGEEEQEQLYRRHPANIVRLDLNRIQRSDTGEDNRYERARRHLFDWLAQGTMVVDRKPTMYAHEQEFCDERGEEFRRRGFVAVTRLADYEEKVVLPHERTLRGPKEDRLQLMKATECNLSQIFFLYDDPEFLVDRALFTDEVEASEPAVDIHTADEICHRLWNITDYHVHERVARALQDRPLLIADGHHRYETALAYRDFRRSIADRDDRSAPYEYVMGFFVNIHDPGLQVFPTHRVVHSVENFDFDALRQALKEQADFQVTPIPTAQLSDVAALRQELAHLGEEGTALALVRAGGGEGFFLRFTGDSTAPFFGDDLPEAVRQLDVAVLHEGVLQSHLNIDREAQEALTNLRYVKSWQDGMKALKEPDTQLVAFMNATPVSQVYDVCLSGGLMPQKSTYFYPKILSGLVLNPL